MTGADLSLRNTGLCLYEYESLPGSPIGKVIDSTVIGAALSKGSTHREQTLRIYKIAIGVRDFALERGGPVVIEGPSYGSIGAKTETGGLHYVVYLELLRASIPFMVVAPKAARKIALGRGAPIKGEYTSEKPWIRDRLSDLFGVDTPKNEHVRDALVLCLAYSLDPQACEIGCT